MPNLNDRREPRRHDELGSGRTMFMCESSTLYAFDQHIVGRFQDFIATKAEILDRQQAQV
jgi:hypothetical protein